MVRKASAALLIATPRCLGPVVRSSSVCWLLHDRCAPPAPLILFRGCGIKMPVSHLASLAEMPTGYSTLHLAWLMIPPTHACVSINSIRRPQLFLTCSTHARNHARTLGTRRTKQGWSGKKEAIAEGRRAVVLSITHRTPAGRTSTLCSRTRRRSATRQLSCGACGRS